MLSDGSNNFFAKRNYISSSPAETLAIGEEIGSHLMENTIISFFGDLGAGKTSLIKGIAKGCAQINEDLINSPTFVYLNIYEGSKTLYHFDLYRLHDVEEFLSMGFDEYLFANGITLIEWSERIAPILPAHTVMIDIVHLGGNSRKISFR